MIVLRPDGCSRKMREELRIKGMKSKESELRVNINLRGLMIRVPVLTGWVLIAAGSFTRIGVMIAAITRMKLSSCLRLKTLAKTMMKTRANLTNKLWLDLKLKKKEMRSQISVGWKKSISIRTSLDPPANSCIQRTSKTWDTQWTHFYVSP